MDRVVVHVHVPGLSRRLWESNALPRLIAAAESDRVATLRCSFPCFPSVVEWMTTREGLPTLEQAFGSMPPADDGPGTDPIDRLVEERLSSLGPEPTNEEAEPRGTHATSLIRVHLHALARAARDDGPRDLTRHPAATQIDRQLAALFELLRGHREARWTVVLNGGPGYGSVHRRVDLSTALARDVAEDEVRVRGCIAWLRVDADRQAMLAARSLMLPGIERVLRGDGLRSWRNAEDAAEDMLLVAEPGHSFESGAAACGRPDLAGDEEPVVVAFGARNPDPWPSAIHDLRLYPTLQSALGAPWISDETPIPL